MKVIYKDYPDKMKSACANCNWIGEPTITLIDIPDLNQRLDPGGEVPSGECPNPKCRSLVYLKGPLKPLPRNPKRKAKAGK